DDGIDHEQHEYECKLGIGHFGIFCLFKLVGYG
ncbi:unnamed protein product, partial [marine sediment metagenome]